MATRQHALIFPPAQMLDDTTVHLFTEDTPTSLFTLRNDSTKCHILGCGDQGMGAMILKFELW